MDDKLNIFENHYVLKVINQKPYAMRAISLKDMLMFPELFDLLFDVVLELQEESTYEYQELFISKYRKLLEHSINNYQEEYDEDFFDLIVELLDLSLPPKLKQLYEEPSSGKEVRNKKSQKEDIKQQKMDLYKFEYLKRLDIKESLFNYVEIAEYLRTKNFKDPYELSLKNLIVLTDIHNRIENNHLIKQLDMYTSAISVFKMKDSKIYQDFITKMTQ